MENKEYQDYLIQKEKEWEALCIRCGSCCGAFEDPCENLARDQDKKSYCIDYENRFGLHKSKSGKEFKCVPIRNVLHKNWNSDYLCAYKEFQKCLIKRLKES
jgi:hypothetical protein